MSKEEKKEAKKRPGRPRKTPEKQERPILGVVEKPEYDNALIELVHNNCIIFKKIFSLLKSLAPENLHIIFRADCTIIWCVDHLKGNEVRIRIDGSKCLRYYCEKEKCIVVNNKDLGLIIARSDKSYSSITFRSNKNNHEYRTRMFVILKTEDDGFEEESSVDLSSDKSGMEDEKRFTDTEKYTIKVDIPGKYYKKMITDMKNAGTREISVTQDSPEKNLMFKYLSASKRVLTRNIVRKKEKTGFKSELAEGESFRVNIIHSFIEPISSANISEKVKLYFHEDKPVLTILHPDTGIEIRILTKISNQD